MVTTTGMDRRDTLTRRRVLEAAVQLADREGVGSVSMRRLGQELVLGVWLTIKGIRIGRPFVLPIGAQA